MDLNYSAAEQAFRAEVRGFLAADLPPGIFLTPCARAGAPRKGADGRMACAIEFKGLAGHTWPEEFGGPGWSPVQKAYL